MGLLSLGRALLFDREREREREREAVFLTITKPAEFYSEGVGSHRRKSLDRLSFASQRRPEVDIPSFS